MKRILLYLFAIVSLTVNAQKQSVIAQSGSHSANYTITENPKLVIGNDKLTLTDRKTEATFSTDERVVLFVNKNSNGANNNPQGDVNGDAKVSISDVTKLIDILLQKTE